MMLPLTRLVLQTDCIRSKSEIFETGAKHNITTMETSKGITKVVLSTGCELPPIVSILLTLMEGHLGDGIAQVSPWTVLASN